MPAAPVEIRLLGPVEAVVDGRQLDTGGRRLRTLLSLLALQPGRPVPGDRLVTELWGDEPPDGADVTLRSYVSRLRQGLGGAATIRASDGGYAIDVSPEQIDRQRFEQLVRDAETDAAAGNHRRAGARLREALGQWRGRPFGELSDRGSLSAEADRLEELRLHGLELRIASDLELGSAAELVDELESLVRAHPYRESFWRQLMLALYRSERQADALAAYHRARTALDEELGIEPGAELRALEAAILRQDVPGPSTATGPREIPEPLTSFIGRDAELRTLRGLLGAARLVTLTGVGGVGKTRLALEAARRHLDDDGGDVLFVDLSALSEPSQVDRHVAGTLGLRELPESSPVEGITAALRDRAALLVLDNCEHVAEASAALAQAILTRCPGMRILATSREPLACPGEVDVPVQPLPLAEVDASTEVIRANDAVALFLARAREVRHGLVEDDATMRRIAEICEDLEGLPLAIELAAARAKSLSLDDIAARLRERFRFLVSWRRLAAARHRTLRQAIDWSFDLLSPAEQELLGRLSVFAGGSTLPAIAAVCLDGDEEAATGLLERLVASSLVNAIHGPGETRYRMLETVREYAAERLAATDATEPLRRRHARYFRRLVDEAWAPIRLAETAHWTARLGAERENLRSALGWATEAGEHEEALRLAEGLWYFWWIRGDLSEGRSWLRRAIDGYEAHVQPPDRLLYSRALGGAARLAWAATEFGEARSLADRAWAALPADAGPLDQGLHLQSLGVISTALEDLPAARGALEQARSRFESLPEGDPWRRDRLAAVLVILGSVHFFEGDYPAASNLYREAMADCLARNDTEGVALCELYLAHVDLLQGQPEDAIALARRALEVYHRLGWQQYLAECFETIAFAAHATGQAAAAVRLVGAADALRDRAGTPATHGMARLRQERLPVLRATLGEAAFASELATGRALSPQEALEEARRADR